MNMSDQEAAVREATEALEAKGLHVYPLSDTVLNVHSGPVSGDGSGDEATYLFTITVTVTP
jgi:hypothetical protein